MAYQFFAHTDLAFGKDSVKELPGFLKADGITHVMIIHGSSVKKTGIADEIIAQVEAAGVEYSIFDRVLPNPTNELVEEAAEAAREAKIDGFIAVGGGSCIDLAKAVNILMTNEGPIGQYGGMNMVKNDVLPLIAIPTTAGTSSEITNVIALMDTVAVCKYVIIDNKLVPTHVIADPEFTKTVPRGTTAATGMDAITHAVESYISNMATPLTEYNSLQGLKIFYENLPKVVEDGSDMKARENMILGCIITGFGFSNANLGLVHGIAHTLSAHFHLAHGDANACVLPYVIAYNAPSCPEKMVDLAKAIGLPLSGDLEKDQYVFAGELEALIKKINIRTLSEHGITEADFDMLADDVLKEPVLGFNPRQGVTKEDIIEILKKAY